MFNPFKMFIGLLYWLITQLTLICGSSVGVESSTYFNTILKSIFSTGIVLFIIHTKRQLIRSNTETDLGRRGISGVAPANERIPHADTERCMRISGEGQKRNAIGADGDSVPRLLPTATQGMN